MLTHTTRRGRRTRRPRVLRRLVHRLDRLGRDDLASYHVTVHDRRNGQLAVVGEYRVARSA